jgi:hypothetical protein
MLGVNRARQRAGIEAHAGLALGVCWGRGVPSVQANLAGSPPSVQDREAREVATDVERLGTPTAIVAILGACSPHADQRGRGGACDAAPSMAPPATC